MTIEQKLIRFAEGAQQKVDDECRKITNEIQEAIKSAVGDADYAARGQKHERIQAERHRLEREANKKVNAASMAVKQELSALRERLANELFAAVEADLRNFTTMPGYEFFLIQKILAKAGKFRFVQIMPRDMHLAERIEAEASLQVESVEEDFIGGFRLLSENRRVVDDHTLLMRIQDIQGEFSL